MFSEPFAGEFMSGAFNSDNLFWLPYDVDWATIVCDATKFAKYFVFPEKVNATAVQLQMCTGQTAGQTLVLKQLFDHWN